MRVRTLQLVGLPGQSDPIPAGQEIDLAEALAEQLIVLGAAEAVTAGPAAAPPSEG